MADRIFTDKKTSPPKRWLLAAIIGIVAAGSLFVWWTIVNVDRGLHAAWLQKVKLVSQSIDINRVKSLTATRADLKNPDYLYLKEQFAEVTRADENCRFVYLMGKKPDGKLFFFVDNESPSSPDYSPPGQIYEEASEENIRIFNEKIAATEKPHTDRWGTWVTGFVPILDPDSGDLIAVLGMDIDASVWKWDLAANAAVPVGITLILLFVVLTAYFSTRHVAPSPKPVLRRLMIPLAAVMFLLVAGSGTLLVFQQATRMDKSSRQVLEDVSSDLRVSMSEQYITLSAIGDLLVLDATMRESLKHQDRVRLLATYSPVLKKMKSTNNVTHLAFFTPERDCLLRVHKPESFGDRNNNVTAMQAEQTGKAAAGIELGLFGTFTVRYVRPVFDGNTLVGYLELGKEIESILVGLHNQTKVEMIATIHKKGLDRARWEEGMKMLGRNADWGRFPDDVVIYSSISPLPSEIGRFINYANHMQGQNFTESKFGGTAWQIMCIQLRDVSDEDIGNLLVLRDISAEKAEYYRLMIVSTVTCLVLITGLFGFLFTLLSRTDTSLAAQQSEIRESDARFRSYFELPLVGIAITSPGKGWLSVNDSLCEMLGYSEQELTSHTWPEITYPDDLDADLSLFERMLAGEVEKYALEKRFIRKDGTIVWVNLSVGCVRKPDGTLDYVVALFQNITERKKAEMELRLTAQMQKLLINISSKYINLPLAEVGTAISASLRELGEFIGADRVYVFEYDFQKNTCSNKYEWCADGISAQIEQLQNVPLDNNADFARKHQQGKIVLIPDVQALPQGLLRETLQPQNIKSLLAVPMMSGEECIGFVGFDSVRTHHVYTDNEINFLTVFSQMLLNLKKRAATETELLHARRREIGIGLEIQNQLLLGHTPENLDGGEVAAFSLPSRNIDGDFYDFLQYDKNHFDLFIGDVMGKGVPAALCGAATKSQFLRAIYDLMCSNTLATLPTLEEIVSFAHAQICDKLIKLESFVTACIARFNFEKMRMDLVDCGHTATIHFHSDSNVCDFVKGWNCPIGFNANEAYEQISVHFKVGDIICFYSDGVIDIQNAAKEFFGIERLTDFIRQNSNMNAQSLSDSLAKQLRKFSGSMFNDDITFIFVKIEDKVSSEIVSQTEKTFTSHPESVNRIRSFIQKVMKENSANEKDILMMELAISEAVANIIKHAYENRHNREITVKICMFSDKAEVYLCHSGKPMGKRQFTTPAFDGSHDTGYGLYLIRSSVDGIELGTDDNGITHIKLTKKFTITKHDGQM